MKKKLAQIAFLGSKIRRRDIQLILALLALAMLILGVGAPSDGGGPFRCAFSL